MFNKQIPCRHASVQLVIDHRCRQNVVKTKTLHISRTQVCHWSFDHYFVVLCDLAPLLNRLTWATWNLLICFIKIFTVKKKIKTDRQPCCVLFGCSRICASLGISKPQNNNIFFHLYFFFFLYLTRYSFFPKYLKGFTWLKQNNCRNTFRKCKSFKAMTQDVNLCFFFSVKTNLFLSRFLGFCLLAKQPLLNISQGLHFHSMCHVGQNKETDSTVTSSMCLHVLTINTSWAITNHSMHNVHQIVFIYYMSPHWIWDGRYPTRLIAPSWL